MPIDLIIYLIVVFELLLNIVFFSFVIDIKAKFLSFFIPTEMYKYTEMNFIGCIIISMFCMILFPLIGIPCVIYSLFHVGRKNVDDNMCKYDDECFLLGGYSSQKQKECSCYEEEKEECMNIKQ